MELFRLMPKAFLRLTAICFLCCSAIGQQPPTAPATKTDDTSADHSQEAFVIEELRTHYRFENDGTGKRETYARVRVQSEAGVAQWGQVVIGYNSANERVEIPYVRVLKKDGSKVEASQDSIQDLSAPVEREAPVYTDYRQKHVPVSGLRPGEVLEYDLISVTHTALAPGQFWAQHDFAERGIVLNEELEIDIPAGRTVKLKTKADLDPKVTEANGRKLYRWTHSHLQADDDNDKKDKKKKKKSKKDLEQPDIQMTTFADWDAVGRWYADLERDRRKPTAEIRSKAEELTKGANTDLEKTEALYDYVAKNFRYVSLSLGLGRYQPHAAGDVFHNQYGDCKDKNTLLAAMLEAEGIHSSSVLINSSRKLDPDVPSPMQFDHAITMVPLGKQEVWLDTTTEIAPFRLLAFPLRDKQALVVASNGVSRLENTPADTPMPKKEIEEIDGKVNELGKLEANVHYVERGDAELVMRMIFRREAKARWERIVEMMISYAGFDGDVSDLKVSDPAETREPFELTFHVEKANYIDWSKKKFDLTMPLSQFSLPDADEDDAASPDAEPVKLGAIGEHTYRLKVELPKKYTGRSPLPFSLARDFAGYEASYKLDGNVFTAERKMTVREREIPAAGTPGYLSFRRAVLADMAQRLSLETTVAGAPTLSKDVTADDLNDAGAEALKSGNFPLAADVFKRALDIDPKHKYAWNNLGRTYLAMQRTDDAIEAFKKQIEINPYDEYAYNNLGRAYRIERKYEDAVAQFRKQIELNPLDQYAHSNLGGVYLDWKKYGEAAPELEKAVSLTPEDPFAQVQLGDAYLNTGQDEKAMAAFDRALEISASPVIWNNISYDLSLKKTHLDKARQYAESAVASTSASLRNVTLEKLSDRELGLVPSLSAYWDTLGWVYFANGDHENAERYVSAAWNLDQRAEVGDHLGQIYEKRGQKTKAIRAYALAMNAFRPESETRGRLAALVGEAHVNAEVEKARGELSAERTIKLGKNSGAGGHADYFVLLEPSANGATAVAVKFVSGDDKLKDAAEPALRSATYPFQFPDTTPTKVFRRGTYSCSKATGECTFVMQQPDDVSSVD